MDFKFSLAPVFEQRRALEEAAQRDYAAAMERLSAVRRRRAELEGEIEFRKRKVHQQQIEGIPPLIRELTENWIEALRRESAALEQDLHRLLVQAEQLRLKLVKAMQDRTVMEKLREQEWREYQAREKQTERHRFDEIAIRNFVMERRREKIAGRELLQPERTAA